MTTIHDLRGLAPREAYDYTQTCARALWNNIGADMDAHYYGGE